MEQILNREERYKKVYTLAIAAYFVTCATLLVYWITVGSLYQAAHSVGAMLLPIAYQVVYKLLRLHRTYELDLMILAFTFLAYAMGVAARWYHLIPSYDKVMHTLSGTFTMLLALPAFYLLKGKHTVCKDDCALAIAFCLAATLAVAGIWEIAEYFLHMLTGIDVQNVAATGINDSMQDMIVCVLGSLLALPSMIMYYRKGKAGLFMGSAISFTINNGGAIAP
ncbi:MAG: hypothetical protein RSJ41_05080 [Clostridia bacterium]